MFYLCGQPVRVLKYILTHQEGFLSILSQLSPKPINIFSLEIVFFWASLIRLFIRYMIGKTNIMLMVFTPVVLKESSFRLLGFHTRAFYVIMFV